MSPSRALGRCGLVVAALARGAAAADAAHAARGWGSLKTPATFTAGAEEAAAAMPDQYFYNETTLSSARTAVGGCALRNWAGADAAGVGGPPWVTTVDCGAGESYADAGVATRGPLQFFVRHGRAMFDGESLDSMGDVYWLGAGAYVDLFVEPNTFVYVVGGAFELAPWRSRRSFVSSSYRAPRRRSYRVADAIAGRGGSMVAADHHIANGSSPSVDLVFSKGKSFVDPPAITVVNCAYDRDPASSFVWYHTHPAGALYLPFTGAICYVTDEERCSSPGSPRWVSPNLFYYEKFYARPAEPSAAAAADLVGRVLDASAAANCTHPIVFGVTNFDPDDAAGQPNFADAPAGPATWGLFDTMTVRSTTIATTTVTTALRGGRP